MKRKTINNNITYEFKPLDSELNWQPNDLKLDYHLKKVLRKYISKKLRVSTGINTSKYEIPHIYRRFFKGLDGQIASLNSVLFTDIVMAFLSTSGIPLIEHIKSFVFNHDITSGKSPFHGYMRNWFETYGKNIYKKIQDICKLTLRYFNDAIYYNPDFIDEILHMSNNNNAIGVYITIRYYKGYPEVAIVLQVLHGQTVAVDYIAILPQAIKYKTTQMLLGVEYTREKTLPFFLWSIDQMRELYPNIKYGAISAVTRGSQQLMRKLALDYGYSELFTVEGYNQAFVLPTEFHKGKKQRIKFALCKICLTPTLYMCGQCKNQFYCSSLCQEKDFYTNNHYLQCNNQPLKK